MSVRLRPVSPEDAEPAGAICYEAFKTIAEQHRFPPDFPTPDIAIDLITYMLSRSDIYGVVAEPMAAWSAAISSGKWEPLRVSGRSQSIQRNRTVPSAAS
jgi:hypothetical protein